MPTINDIRTYMTSWKQHTYRQGLDYCYAVKKDKVAYELTIEVLQRQGLEQKNMDGNSVQSIPIKNEGKVDIIFTDLFWQLAEGFISPANYVGTIVSKCVEQGITQDMAVAGIVGRGLRAFPSFLREMDLTYKLSQYFPDAEIKNGPEQDVGDHTDILIEAGNKTYRVWSYQNFERGLANTASRVRGNRGEVPKGIHVLCPIDIGNNSNNRKFIYNRRLKNMVKMSNEQVRKIEAVCESKLVEVKTIGVSKEIQDKLATEFGGIIDAMSDVKEDISEQTTSVLC